MTTKKCSFTKKDKVAPQEKFFGGYRAHFNAANAVAAGESNCAKSLTVEVDQSGHFGGLAIQPAETNDAKDWNRAVEFAAQDLVKMCHQSIPETSFAFQLKESSGMDDFVAALNRYEASEMVGSNQTVDRPQVADSDNVVDMVPRIQGTPAGATPAEVPHEMRSCCLPLFGRR